MNEFVNNGCSVTVLSSVGQGVPDLVIGCVGLTLVGEIDEETVKFLREKGVTTIQNTTILVEVKDGLAPANQQKLTPSQVRWHGKWRGNKIVVRSVEEVKQLLGKKD